MAKRVAIDIGSTVIKVAELGQDGSLVRQEFNDRDFELGIAGQVCAIRERLPADAEVMICSSANGGLRVGIVCLTPLFSGAVFRNQVLLAGANPIYVHDYDQDGGDLRPVDILLLGGGIDCSDAAPFGERLARFRAQNYRYGTLIYAGNKHFAEVVTQSCPEAVVIDNPLSDGLRGRNAVVTHALRDAYLDDLVQKEGVSELQGRISGPIRPSPEVVNRGFHRVVSNRSALKVSGPSILIDIGGATTDLHYTVEIVSEDSPCRPAAGSSVARYVFTDLGIFASRDSTLLQMRTHARTFEFLSHVQKADLTEIYTLLREGEYDASPELLAYACLFLSLDRFVYGGEQGLPRADFDKVTQVMLTGGGAQALDESTVAKLVRLFSPKQRNEPEVLIDRRYQIWAEGITWSTNTRAAA